MIRNKYSFLVLLAAMFLPALHALAQIPELGDGGPGPVKAPHLTAEMVSLAPSVSPGSTVTVGLVATMEPHWHVYWINAGDAGVPPTIKWTLPAGVSAGEMQFPIPSKLPNGPLMDYGYEDIASFPVTISVAANVKPGPIHLDAKVTWLVCSAATCLPGKAHLGLDLNVAAGSPVGQPLGALGRSLSQMPVPLPKGMAFSVLGGAKEFVLNVKTGVREKDADFFPLDPDVIANGADQNAVPTPDGIAIHVVRSPELAKLPATLHGLVKFSDTLVYEVSGPVVPGEAPAVRPVESSGKVTALGAIGLALLGGIILNLMPCVFPVLFLKGLALVQSSGEERQRMRGHGLVYTLGILVSFWVIVAVLLVLRAGGSKAGWGFQLQSPAFIAVLAAFLFFFAMSLAGQFDLGLSLTSAGGDLAKKEGYGGSFFTGVLATIVATPCTAPLMGAAIGFALAQPPAITFAVFTALGLGLALPYLLLTLQPAWTKWLPRPGAWMEVMKQVTAVPLFATVIWLTWVFGRLFSSDSGAGADHIARLLLCFLVLAVAGWVLGRWPANGKGAIVATLLCVGAVAIPLTETKQEAQVWAPYSASALQAARASGKPVFIDFTAAWCLSCQVNEKAVLHSAEVEKQLEAKHFVLIRADWTQYNEDITAELKSVGRSGVPTYVIYPAGAGAPDVLPELLTKGVVLDAIGRDAK